MRNHLVKSRQVLASCLVLLLAACQTVQKQEPTIAPQSPEIGTFSEEMEKISSKPSELPRDAIVLSSPYFELVYNKGQNIAYYSRYTLSADNLRIRKGKRRDNFHSDKRLMEHGVSYLPKRTDYHRPYDRGHLAPAADFLHSQEAVDFTFVMSNMVPQKDRLNRQAWETLEETVRTWACTEELLEIVSGPILEENLPHLKNAPIPIPKKFFKAIYDLTPPRKMIGFIMHQEDGKVGDHKKRVVSVTEIENEVGYPVFASINTTKTLKTKSDLNSWIGSRNCINTSK